METTSDPTKKMGLLDGIEVEKPDRCVEKTKLYVCGIRPLDELKRFEFQIRVGPAAFSSQTFEWRGKGENAQQVFRDGALQRFSDAQIQEIRSKLKTRYIRFAKNKAGEITGPQEVDSSDGGVIEPPSKDHPQGYQREPLKVPGRLRGDERPLHEILLLEPVYDNPKLNGRVLTVEDLKRMLEEAQAEDQRLTEGGDAVFSMLEAGKGGKGSKTEKAGSAAPRDVKTAVELSTTDGKRKAEGGFIPDRGK